MPSVYEHPFLAETQEEAKFFIDSGRVDIPEPNAPKPETEAVDETAVEDQVEEATEDQVEEATEGTESEADDGTEERNAKPDAMVPLAKLIEVRKKFQDKLRDTQKNFDTLSSRLERIVGARDAKDARPVESKTTEEAIPDYETNPLGHLRYIVNKQNEIIQSIQKKAEEEVEKQSEYSKQQEEVVKFNSWLASQREEYVMENPDIDYQGAIQFAIDERDRELLALGYKDANMRRQFIEKQIIETGIQCAQLGHNPAEVFVNFARYRGFGQNPKEEMPPIGRQRVDAQKPVQRDIKKIAQGQKQAKSTATGGGASKIPTPEELAHMSDVDFDRLFDVVMKD